MASPPPLQHPKPTHPPYKIPSTSPPPPSDTPPSQYGASSYQRFSSPTEPSSNGFYNGSNQQQQESYVYQGSHYISPQQHTYANQPSGQYSSQHGYGDWMQSQIGAWGVNDATAAMGVQFGRSAIGAGQEYVEKNLTKWLPLTYLKHSFNVSNLYVARKIRLVLFPWRHKPWARQIRRTETGGQAEGYKPPREDINSPDLYIPLMSLTTYVLLSGLHSGLSGKFNPSMMGSKSSTAMGVLFLEILLIKFFCYLFNVGSEATMVDLLAYQGYKFVGVIICICGRLLGLSGFTYWSIFLYVFLANAFFLLRSLGKLFLRDTSSTNVGGRQPPISAPSPYVNDAVNYGNSGGHAQRKVKMAILLGIAGCQIFSMYILSRV